MMQSDVPHHGMANNCALYVLGALEPAAESAFELHLGDCVECQRECERLGPAAMALARLEPIDLSRLLDVDDPMPGDSNAGGPLPVTGAQAALDIDAAASEPSPRPVSVGPSSTQLRDADAPRSWRLRSSRRVGWVVGAGALTAVLCALGWTYVSSPPDDRHGGVVSASASPYGQPSIRLDATIGGRGTGLAEVRATVTGLMEGDQYVLLAVTRDGETVELIGWVAIGTIADVRASAAIDPKQLAFLSVARADGAVLVSTPIPAAPSPTK